MPKGKGYHKGAGATQTLARVALSYKRRANKSGLYRDKDEAKHTAENVKRSAAIDALLGRPVSISGGILRKMRKAK